MVTYSNVRQLLRYLLEEKLGSDIGILLQVWIAEGDESSDRGREEASLESKRERVGKSMTIIDVDNEQKQGCRLHLPSNSPHFFRLQTFVHATCT